MRLSNQIIEEVVCEMAGKDAYSVVSKLKTEGWKREIFPEVRDTVYLFTLAD